ncbi:DNA-(apurinic or apyrimidinic site) lyase 2, partial [Stegodyphus mimosarum]
MNIACCPIDHCDPGDEKEFNASEARQWLKCFLSNPVNSIDGNISIVDAFRHFYPDKKEAYTCWNAKTGARLTNYGTRIDYVLLSSNLLPLLMNCDILSDYDGSDHCPVTAVLKCESVSEKSVQLPSICTRLWPEFCGRQQTIQSFLQKVQNTADQITNFSDIKVQPLSSKNKLSQRKSAQKSIKSFLTIKSNIPDHNSTNKNDIYETEIEQSEQKPDKEAASSDSFELNFLGTEYDEISLSPRLNQAMEWKSVFRGPPKPPLCSGHSKECVLRTVKKKGPNCGRQFFMCAQPAGHP